MPLRKPTADTTRAIDAFRAVLLHGPTSWPGAITAGDAMELLEVAAARWPEAVKAAESAQQQERAAKSHRDGINARLGDQQKANEGIAEERDAALADARRYREALELIAADSALADDPMAIAETVLGGGTERDCRE